MKVLKFQLELADLILRDKKTTTWRVNDEKDLTKDDIVSARVHGGDEFAQIEITSVKETTFGELKDVDWKGHENFKSKKEMYDVYSSYYKMKITPTTKLKVIKFRKLKERQD
ncbi:MAG: ASCH domain-containing protein [Candidatus Altiarchaeota archaeon]|nr:ASCH domain-containing protein [Candidatus Altiarchaeota archaeon]